MPFAFYAVILSAAKHLCLNGICFVYIKNYIKFSQNGSDSEITPDKPCIYQSYFKIANLRPVEAHLEKNRVNIPAKCNRGPYFRAYENCNKACIYRYFWKISLKLSIWIKFPKIEIRINKGFFGCQNGQKPVKNRKIVRKED